MFASADGSIWLRGDVIMCACPDCSAPMSIRLWLMLADCWRCATTIELDEEQEREVERLIKRRDQARQERRLDPRAADALDVGAPIAGQAEVTGQVGIIEHRVFRVGDAKLRVVALVTQKPSDRGRGATSTGADHDPGRYRRRFTAHLVEHRFRDVVIATPVGGAFGVGKLIHVVAVELAREADGVSIHSLSAIAWDRDEAILYAVSDQARLYHFRPLFADGRLVSLDYLESHPLRGKDGDRLKGRKSDSEGAHVMHGDNGKQGDSEILVAFERDPRIERYSPDGNYLGKIKLPKALRKVENYSAPNNALECVTWHPRYGIMTLPQKPQQDGHFLYAADGKRWPYAMTPMNDNEVVSLEVIMSRSPRLKKKTKIISFRILIFPLRLRYLISR